MRRQRTQDSHPDRTEPEPRARRRAQADRRAVSGDDPAVAERQRRDVHAGAGHRHLRELARRSDVSRALRTSPALQWNRDGQNAGVPAV